MRLREDERRCAWSVYLMAAANKEGRGPVWRLKLR